MDILQYIKQQGGSLIADYNTPIAPMEKIDLNSIRLNFATTNADPMGAFNAYIKASQLAIQREGLKQREKQLEQMNVRAQEAEVARLARDVAAGLTSKDINKIPNFPKYDKVREEVASEMAKIVDEANTARANRDPDTLLKLKTAIPFRLSQIEGYADALRDGAALDVFSKMNAAKPTSDAIAKKSFLELSESMNAYLNDNKSGIGQYKASEEEDPVLFDLASQINKVSEKYASMKDIQEGLKNIKKRFEETTTVDNEDGTRTVLPFRPERVDLEKAFDLLVATKSGFDSYLYKETQSYDEKDRYPLFGTDEQLRVATEKFKTTFLDGLYAAFDATAERQKTTGKSPEQIQKEAEAKAAAKAANPLKTVSQLSDELMAKEDITDATRKELESELSKITTLIQMGTASQTEITKALSKYMDRLARTGADYQAIKYEKIGKEIDKSKNKYISAAEAEQILGFNPMTLESVQNLKAKGSKDFKGNIVFTKTEKGAVKAYLIHDYTVGKEKLKPFVQDEKNISTKDIKSSALVAVPGVSDLNYFQEDNAKNINEIFGTRFPEVSTNLGVFTIAPAFGFRDENVQVTEISLNKLAKDAFKDVGAFEAGGDFREYSHKIKNMPTTDLISTFSEDNLAKILSKSLSPEVILKKPKGELYERTKLTKLPSVTRRLLTIVDAFAKDQGIEYGISSVYNRPLKVKNKDGEWVDYKNENSQHYSGLAVDYKINGMDKLLERGLDKIINELGFKIIKHADNSTAIHYHIQFGDIDFEEEGENYLPNSAQQDTTSSTTQKPTQTNSSTNPLKKARIDEL
jgi:hypothetical protein